MQSIIVAPVFDEAWCNSTLAYLQQRGFCRPETNYPSSYRTNDRWVCDDDSFTDELFRRIEPLLPQRLLDEQNVPWTLAGLNPRLRACRYQEGQWFGVHRDGVFWKNEKERSHLSLLVYLDDDFTGGTTRFFQDRTATKQTGSIVPKKGQVAIFSHSHWHDGAPVERGCKHVLRTDVLYRSDATDREGHLGYVWALAGLERGALVVSGGRDQTLRFWDRAKRTLLATHHAHEASITALATHGETLFSGARDQRIKRWRATRDTLVAEETITTHTATVLALCMMGSTLVSSGADGNVFLHGAETQLLHTHRGWAWSVAAIDDHRCASVGDDGVLVLTRPHKAFALGVPLRAVTHCGPSHLAVGTIDGRIFVVSLTDGNVSTVLQAHDASITALTTIAPMLLASAAEDDRVRVWNLETHRLVYEKEHADFARAVLADAHGLVSAGYDGRLHFASLP